MRQARANIKVDAGSGTVIHALTGVDAMRRWWGVHHGHVEPRPGGAWALAWCGPVEGFGYVVLAGQIRVLSPGRWLIIDKLLYFNRERPVLGPMTLTFEVLPSRSSSIVDVIQEGYGEGKDWDWYYELARENWPRAIQQLKEYVQAVARRTPERRSTDRAGVTAPR